MRGRGAMPSNSSLQKLAVESYSTSPMEEVDGFTLMKHTPTLKFYKGKDNTIVVAIRGTNDARDVKADAMIAVNALEKSDRVKEDLETLSEFQKEHTGSEYDYYGVGHSLGGAVLDIFLTKGLLKQGVSYNPAIQPLDIRRDIPNKRIYNEGDALYKTMGQFAKNTEVRKRKGVKEYLASKVPIYSTLYSHKLDRFEGGMLGHYNASF